MTISKRRGPFVALATGLFLILTFDSSPGDTPVPSTPPPTPEEIQALEEIATWLIGPPKDLRLLKASDLKRSRPLAFELFRSYTEEEYRREFLLDLPFGADILEAADRHHIDGLLVAALVDVESSFTPGVVSSKGAVGLMQVLPSTAQVFGEENLFDPQTNLDVGIRYLNVLLDRYDGRLELALAAYNAGPASVSRYGGIPPFRETRRYVRRVLSRYVDYHRTVWDSSGATNLILYS